MTCVRGLQDGAIWEHDGDWVRVWLFVDDMCVAEDEVAGGASVRKGVLWFGGRCVDALCVVVVVVVVIVEEGKTIGVSVRWERVGGQLKCSVTIIFWITGYCVYIYSRPDLSSLVGRRVDRHDCFVDSPFGDEVTEGLELRYVLASASDLVIRSGIVAGCAGVPNSHVVAAQETVVLVVEVFVVVHRSGAAIGRRGERCSGEHTGGRGRGVGRVPPWGGRAECPWLLRLRPVVVVCPVGDMVASCCVIAASCC